MINEQLNAAQDSQLGVDLSMVVTDDGSGLMRQVLSATGFADDVSLLSTSATGLKLLLYLTKIYCDKFQVKLVASKTKLLVFTTRKTELKAKIELASIDISIDGNEIVPSPQATHVGVERSPEGNAANISSRLTAHRKAVFGLLHAGLAKGHRANPAASVKVEAVYGVPVLLSGLGSIVLAAKEEKFLDQYHKVHLQRLLRLHQATPAPVVFLLAGCLPLSALIHLRMFSIFGQLCRLRGGDNIMARHALSIFSSSNPSCKSWFWRIRELCLQYGLSHPSNWLSTQPTKEQVKAHFL